MARSHVPLAAGVVNFVIVVAALSAMNSQLYITARMMFSLARAGYAPRRFGELSARGTPVSALLLSSIGIALAAVLNALFPDAAFALMLALSMFGALFTWMMIFVTHLFFRRAHTGKYLAFRMWGYPYSSLLGTGLMVAILLTTAFTGEFHMTLACGLPTLALFCVAWRLQRQPSS
jgi:L-asparagine transporter-like permease